MCGGEGVGGRARMCVVVYVCTRDVVGKRGGGMGRGNGWCVYVPLCVCVCVCACLWSV